MEKTSLWIIHPIHIERPNKSYDISVKLPAHFKICRAVGFSVLENLYSPNAVTKHFGEISLQFNSRRIFPIHTGVEYKRIYRKKTRELLDVNVSLVPNQVVSGFYKDLGKTFDAVTEDFEPYTLNLYFQCTNETELTDDNSKINDNK